MKHFNTFKRLLLIPLLLMVGVPAFAQPLSGVYTIGGTSPNYATLAAAANDLNNRGVSGDVWFKIRTGTYSSNTNWVADIGSVSGASATNRITFESESGNKGDVTIANANSSSRNYIFNLEDASYITIRNMTLKSTSSSRGRIITASGDVHYDSIYNCTLEAKSSSSSSSNHRVIYATDLTGGHNVIYNNVINNGSYGIYWYGDGSSNRSDNDVIANNTLTKQYSYGVYAYYTTDLQVTGNDINKTNNTTTYYGIYLRYCMDALRVNDNDIHINISYSTCYGIYSYDCEGSSSNSSKRTQFKSNDIYIKGTSGTKYGFYLNDDNNWGTVSDNEVEMQVTSGSLYTMYVDNSEHLTIEDNTFKATATSSGRIYNQPAYSCDYVVFKDNVLTLKTKTGAMYPMYYAGRSGSNNQILNNTVTGTVSSYGSVYAWYYFAAYTASNNVASGNVMTFSQSSSGTKYGLYRAMYSNSDYNAFVNNKMTFTGGTGGVYNMYYSVYSGSSNNVLSGNTMHYTANTYSRCYGMYSSFYSSCHSNVFANNDLSITNARSGYVYGTYQSVYSSSSDNVFTGNDFNLVNTSSGYAYGLYYFSRSNSHNNDFTNNTLTVKSNTRYAYGVYYSYYTSNNGIFANNKIDISSNYHVYGIYLTGYNQSNNFLFADNDIKVDAGSSHFAYGVTNMGISSGLKIKNNKLDVTAGSTAYGLMSITSTTNAEITGNEVSAVTTNGTVYGLYFSSLTSGLVKNNTINIKGTATCYGLYVSTVYDGKFINNTFVSHGTGTSYAAQIYQYPGTQNQSSYFRNNIFANMMSSNPAVRLQYLHPDIDMDYNNFYSRSSTPAYSVVNVQSSYSGSPTGSWNLDSWRDMSGNDKGSLAFNPGFIDSSSNLRPDPTRPESWSVNGRGVHIPGNDKDILGNTRVTDKADGVPDLGAYEFVPTSTPPLARAVPANPNAGGTQVFTFGQDTVLVMDWPNTPTPPTTLDVRQYTGKIAPGINALGPTYMYFYVDAQPDPAGTYESDPKLYYKDPWTGTMSESSLRMAQKETSTTPWFAHSHTFSGANVVRNFIHLQDMDNFGLMTGSDIANNAGVLAITAPEPRFCAGSYTLKVKIANLGNNTINNVEIGWSVDGIPKPPVSYSTAIPTSAAGNSEVEIALGTVTFANKWKHFKIWTSNPNNTVDPVPTDDTLFIDWGPGLSGEYTVGGTTPDFATVADAVAALHKYGVCGPVWFNIRDGNYTGSYDLVDFDGMSSTNRVTFQSESGLAANVVLTTSDPHVFRISDAADFTIRNLSLTATGTSAATGVLFEGSNLDRDTVDGCKISVPLVTSSYVRGIYGVNIEGNNISVMNCEIQGGYYGVYLDGNNSSSNPNNLYIFNNSILNVYYYSVYLYYGENARVDRNYINTSSTTGRHLMAYYCDKATFSNNKILMANKTYSGMYIYYTDGTSSKPVRVFNNVISMGSGGNVTPTAGIYGYRSHYVHYYNNSVAIDHSSAPAIYLYNAASAYDNNKILNNVFVNYGGGPAMKAYTPTGNNVYDYNNYYTTGSKVIAPYSGSGSYDSLTLWRDATGEDMNSLSYDPGFLTQTNLQPDVNNPSAWSLNGRGVHIDGNDEDFNGNPRVVNREDGVPDIGAYEFVPNTIPPVAKAIPATVAAGATQVFTFGQDTVARITWDPNTAVPATVDIRQYTGTVPPNFPVAEHMYFYTDLEAIPVTYILDADIYYKDPWTGKIDASDENEIRMIRKESNNTPWTAYNDISSRVDISRNTLTSDVLTGLGYFTGVKNGAIFSVNIEPASSVVFCPGGSVSLHTDVTGTGYTYQWLLNGNNIPGATGATYTAIQAGDYSVRVNNGVETVTSNQVAVTIVSTPTAVVNVNGPTTICSGNTVTLTTNTGSGLDYQWQRNGTDIAGATGTSLLVTAGGDYSIRVKNIGCVNISAPVKITQAPVNVSLGNDTSFCALHPLNLDAGNAGARYRWSTGDTTQTLTINQYGKQTIWVEVDAGVNCVAKDTIDVDISPMPSVKGISYVKSENTYQFSPSGPEYVDSYLWIFGDGSTDTTASIIHEYEGGNYTLKLVVFNGCGSDTAQIGLPLTVENVVGSSAISLYPNPAQDWLTISIDAAGQMFNDISVVNVIGQVVLHETEAGNAKQRQIDVRSLPDGHYIIRAKTNDGEIVSKPFQILR